MELGHRTMLSGSVMQRDMHEQHDGSRSPDRSLKLRVRWFAVPSGRSGPAATSLIERPPEHKVSWRPDFNEFHSVEGQPKYRFLTPTGSRIEPQLVHCEKQQEVANDASAVRCLRFGSAVRQPYHLACSSVARVSPPHIGKYNSEGIGSQWE
ncbi:hypothetical protein VTK56DRAFT_7239 [Thermocarpiscus australiensis]